METVTKTDTLEGLVNEKLGRRAFLKLTGMGIFVAATASLPAVLEAAQPKIATKHRYGMVIDLKRCVNCKACTVACKLENKTPPGVAYNPVIEEEIGEFPYVQRRWFPKPCFHCDNPPCTHVCPVTATYKRQEDGIVIVDYDKCIGCRYCITACPYGARYFDFGENYPAHETEYGKIPSPEFQGEYGLRHEGKSPVGNVRKCTFCLHLQDANGHYMRPPACAETCMAKAIHFGDLAPNAEGNCIAHKDCNLKQSLVERKWLRLKEELGTEPSVYYVL
ncbi:MAG: 4Fe-4S dicluster domain-containing protein [Candidatus Omnitrophica bacterium]|nr:4Fe-4S dicluster domain-containing protein [Candidatus Omnitrophota bacterium]